MERQGWSDFLTAPHDRFAYARIVVGALIKSLASFDIARSVLVTNNYSIATWADAKIGPVFVKIYINFRQRLFCRQSPKLRVVDHVSVAQVMHVLAETTFHPV